MAEPTKSGGTTNTALIQENSIETNHRHHSHTNSCAENIAGSTALADLDKEKTFYWNLENGRPVYVGIISVNIDKKENKATMTAFINDCEYRHDITPEEAQNWQRSDDITRLEKFNQVFDEIKIDSVSRELQKARKEIYKEEIKIGSSPKMATNQSILETTEIDTSSEKSRYDLKSIQDATRINLSSLDMETSSPEQQKNTLLDNGKQATMIASAIFQNESREEQSQGHGLKV